MYIDPSQFFERRLRPIAALQAQRHTAEQLKWLRADYQAMGRRSVGKSRLRYSIPQGAPSMKGIESNIFAENQS